MVGVTSFPHTAQPGGVCLAKSSTRGRSPISSTILSRISAGFLLCCWSGERTTLRTLPLMRFGFPLVASRQTKGHPKRQATDIHQFIISPIEAHSKKPDETRDKIVALMGDRPRVELFARQTTPGWDVWGNEVEPTAGLWSRWPEDSGKEDVSCPM